jgi:hypothetical protein
VWVMPRRYVPLDQEGPRSHERASEGRRGAVGILQGALSTSESWLAWCC